ncbi:MAG: NAD(P)-dependent oxidoreductase, partial [Pseudomonadota bacterium]
MKIAITGASGFIGQQLIPHLHAQGHDLVVLGRDPDRLTQLFDGAYPAFGYDTLAAALAGCDAVVHLAVLNTTAANSASTADYHAANVDLVAHLLTAARSAGLKKIINFDTFQGASDTNIYAKTKAEGAALLANPSDIESVQIKLPIVYGDRYTGKLSRLNSLPAPLRAPLRHVLNLAKPVVHIDRVAAAVSQELARAPGDSRVRFVSDAQQGNWAYAITKWIVDYSFALTI